LKIICFKQWRLSTDTNVLQKSVAKMTNLKDSEGELLAGDLIFRRPTWPIFYANNSGFFIIIFSHGVRLSPLGTAGTLWPIVPAPDDDDDDNNNDNYDCGAIGGMRIGRRNQSTRRIPDPVPLYPPQIPHDLIRARTRAAGVGSRRINA
jgi:hypothetical protein